MKKQNFGGKWTTDKLNILSSYLAFYLTALKKQSFNKIYIDAFAGTGKIAVGDEQEEIEGSVRLALNSAGKFDEYIFIEKKKAFARELQRIVDNEYSELRDKVTIINDDCNVALTEICKNTDWKSNRAILFLDPYATEVKWDTLKIVSSTKAFDVWYLFPFSAAVRMMKNDGKIDDSWKVKLNMLFGDDGWFDRFYMLNPQMTLFDEENNDNLIKVVNTLELSNYITERLQSIFSAVAKSPKLLYNTRNTPLFLFCFAVANDNPRAYTLAMRCADHILR